MSRLPALGPRGEGWVVIQIVLFWLVAAAGVARSGDWTGLAAAATTIAGLGLIVAGAGLAISGGTVLAEARALTAVPRPRAEAPLVDAGAYRLVRHPIYGGLVLAAVGWGLVRSSIPALVAAGVVVAFFDLKRRREEVWLRERYPGYDEYAARTRRMIPWLY